MNIGIIFAAGNGSRMNNNVPKQFLLVNKKPILAYTINNFEQCKSIDNIILVVSNNYINKVKKIIEKYNFKKVISIVIGGKTALESQYFGLKKAKQLFGDDCYVVFHDGVRPLVGPDFIEKCLLVAKEKGNSITVSPALETIGVISNNTIEIQKERNQYRIIRAPQTYYLKDIYDTIESNDNFNCVDTASLMTLHGRELFFIDGPSENVKITTLSDLVFFREYIKKNYEKDN